MKYSCFSVANLCLTLCDTKDCSMPGLPVLRCFLEFAQTHVHCVDDAIQPSQTLFPPSPLALNLSQHQGLFQWVGSLHEVAKVLELQHHSPSNEYSGLISFRIDWFDLLAVQGTVKVFSHTIICFIKTFMGNWKQEDSTAMKAVVLADLGNGILVQMLSGVSSRAAALESIIWQRRCHLTERPPRKKWPPPPGSM